MSRKYFYIDYDVSGKFKKTDKIRDFLSYHIKKEVNSLHIDHAKNCFEKEQVIFIKQSPYNDDITSFSIGYCSCLGINIDKKCISIAKKIIEYIFEDDKIKELEEKEVILKYKTTASNWYRERLYKDKENKLYWEKY